MVGLSRTADALEPASTRAAGAAKQFKRRLKALYLRGQRVAAGALFAYSPDTLEAAVRSLGIHAGDCLFVHSAFRIVSGFTGTAGDIVDRLVRILGPDGHLLMMSIPYRGSSQRYAESNPVFDVLRTPSAVGLISEVFRRRDGVRRSLSPLHPVLAHGPLADWLTIDHDKVATSCGKGSPFERFLTLDGAFLFLDAPFSSLTFMHYIEDHLKAKLPVALYAPEPASVRVRDRSGVERDVRQFVFSEAARARRHFGPLEQALRRTGALRTAKIGNSRLLYVRANSVVQCARLMTQAGSGIYR